MERKRAAIIVFVLSFLLLIFGSIYHRNDVTKTPEAYAKEIIETCGDRSYVPRCYEEEIPKLLDRGLSFEEVFAVVAFVQKLDTQYSFCHVLAHNIAAKEAAKDLSKWTEVVARAPSGICSNGAIHGAFQERFRDEVIPEDRINEVVDELKGVCQFGREYTDVEQAHCYHALGHLTVYATQADIFKSISICEQVEAQGRRDYTQNCYEGAFMQVFQPLEPEDYSLVAGVAPNSQQEAIAFCNQFNGLQKSSCQKESWPLFRDDILEYPNGVVRFCDMVESGRERSRCYTSMFYILVPQMNFDTQRVSAMCDTFPTERVAQCYATAAGRFVETDYSFLEDSIEICSIAEAKGSGSRCYEELLFLSAFNYTPESDEFTAFCSSLPEPWQTRCFNREGDTIPLHLDPQ